MREDVWDGAGVQQSFSSFTGKNLTYSNEDFRPAEEMAQQLENDEKDQEMEYAAIPGQRARETLNWEENVGRGRMPEMSFGEYCTQKIQKNDIREVYSNASPKKRSNRVALVELSTNESAMEEPSITDQTKLEKFIKSYKSPQAANLVRNFGRSTKDIHKMTQQAEKDRENSQIIPTGLCDLLGELNFENIMKKAELERSLIAEKEMSRTRLDNPVKDDTVERSYAEDENIQQESCRGLKRRTSSISSDTPRSALGKCLRSKSPSNVKDMQSAAALLKPRILPDESVFKMPYPSDSTLKGTTGSSGISSMSKSPSNSGSR
jgi:hypothetical protein